MASDTRAKVEAFLKLGVELAGREDLPVFDDDATILTPLADAADSAPGAVASAERVSGLMAAYDKHATAGGPLLGFLASAASALFGAPLGRLGGRP